MNIGWPEGIMIALLTLRLITHAHKDGQPMDLKYNFGMTLIVVAIWCGLLYWGGFFS